MGVVATELDMQLQIKESNTGIVINWTTLVMHAPLGENIFEMILRDCTLSYISITLMQTQPNFIIIIKLSPHFDNN